MLKCRGLVYVADGTDDKLVIAVGSTSNTHGVKGLEHCFQLKTVPDAQQIRRRVMGESTGTGTVRRVKEHVTSRSPLTSQPISNSRRYQPPHLKNDHACCHL